MATNATNRTPNRSNPGGWIALFIGVALIAIVVIMVWNDDDDVREETNLGDTTTELSDIDTFIGTSNGLGVKDAEDVLADNIDDSVGTTIKVRGEVNETHGAEAFTLDSDGAIGGDEVLVLYDLAKVGNGTVVKGKEVVVQGELKRFSIEELKQQLPGTLWDDDAIENLANKPVIVSSDLPAH